METEKVIQISVNNSVIYVLTNRGNVWAWYRGTWEQVILPGQLDKTLKEKKDETDRKNKRK
jgi:hypothetical protein